MDNWKTSDISYWCGFLKMCYCNTVQCLPHLKRYYKSYKWMFPTSIPIQLDCTASAYLHSDLFFHLCQTNIQISQVSVLQTKLKKRDFSLRESAIITFLRKQTAARWLMLPVIDASNRKSQKGKQIWAPLKHVEIHTSHIYRNRNN